MKLAIMQPYLFPYIGYFQLINSVDQFVIYDDVNFIKKGWINRNNIIVNNQKKLFTISLSGASQNKLINEINISDNFERFVKTLEFNYSKAPFFTETMDLIRLILQFPNKNLGPFIANSLRIINQYVGIQTELLMSSELNKDNSLKGQKKIMAICKELNATTYINPIGGTELYDKEFFKENGIDLYFLKSISLSYKQFDLKFEPFLSIIDVLMHNSPGQIRNMLNSFDLV